MEVFYKKDKKTRPPGLSVEPRQESNLGVIMFKISSLRFTILVGTRVGHSTNQIALKAVKKNEFLPVKKADLVFEQFKKPNSMSGCYSKFLNPLRGVLKILC